jgi:hypothetical protein
VSDDGTAVRLTARQLAAELCRLEGDELPWDELRQVRKMVEVGDIADAIEARDRSHTDELREVADLLREARSKWLPFDSVISRRIGDFLGKLLDERTRKEGSPR